MKLQVLAVLGLVGTACASIGGFKELVVEEADLLTLEVIPELIQAASHYGNPEDGCEDDEVAVRIQGVQGAVCSPKCNGMECPGDIPDGCEATPQCMLQDASSGAKYCALACTKGTNCGKGASCKILFPGIGLCTYD